MDNTSIFLESFLHVPHRVCHRKMKPFCMAHLLTLQHLKSPLLVGGIVSLNDLIIAANVCSSSSFDEIQAKLSKRSLIDWTLSKQTEAKRFEAYYKDFCLMPDFIQKQGSGGQADGLPWSVCMVMRALQHSNYTLDELMFLPLGQLAWITLGINFIETGETPIESDTEKMLVERLRAMGV